MILERLTRLLETEFEVIGVAGDGLLLVETALIPDISMSASPGIEAAIKLRESGCPSKLVFLTVHNDPDFVRAWLSTGTHGYLLKACIVHGAWRAISHMRFARPSRGAFCLSAHFRSELDRSGVSVAE
jgi:DNA-binding NarL/FixJ family response regulator